MSKNKGNKKSKDNKKNKYFKFGIVILVLIIVYVVVLVGYLNPTSSTTQSQGNSSLSTNTTSTDSATTNTKATTQTIEKTLSSSGQISSSQTEVLSLSTSKYFKEIYVEEGDIIKSGANILKYSDGTYITASYDCVISGISIPSVGSKATSENSIEIQNVKTLYMTLDVSESEVSSVAVGQEATIKITAYSDKEYTGKITKISEIGTYSSSGSTFTATISFENDRDIKIGMSASCTIILEKAENVITVPNEAVQTKSNEKYVVVVNQDGSTTDVKVEIGISNDAYTEIKSGLTGSETVQMTVTTSSSSSGNGRTMNFDRGSQAQGGGQMIQMQVPPNTQSGGNR